jgi:hypothetical protein
MMRGMTDSPMNVPLEVLAEARARARRAALQAEATPADPDARAEWVAQDLVDRVALGVELPTARRLTKAEAEAISGPPYDEDS